MLDPFTSLSLACSLVQLIDFGSRVLSKAHDFYKQGSDLESERLRVQLDDLKFTQDNQRKRAALRNQLPDGVDSYDPTQAPKAAPLFDIFAKEREATARKKRQGIAHADLSLMQKEGNLKSRKSKVDESEDRLEAMSEEILAMNRELRLKRRQDFILKEDLAKEEKALDVLLNHCIEVADDIIRMMDKFEANTMSNMWKSSFSALQAVWNKDKFEQMFRILDSLRGELVLRTLAVLSAKLDVQNTGIEHRLDSVAKDGKEIIEVMAINQRTLKSHATHLHDMDQSAAEQRHEEAIAAILTLRNGDTKYISRQPEGDRMPIASNKPYTETVMAMREDFNEAGSRVGTVNIGNGNTSFVQAQILNCLHFRDMTHRMDDVATAYRKTFEWVFDADGRQQRPWDDILDWFRCGVSCYWVNGKAGAGKSTFVKFLHDSERVRSALQDWAGTSRLVVASFFFWNLGSKLQKSQHGVLRSLLYQILEAQPELIPCVLPDLYRRAVIGRDGTLAEPSLVELKKAFQRLLTYRATPIKICLFIDGIDEYEGDHAELAELFASIASDAPIKALISSRPIPACVDLFDRFPKLLLQDLTRDDIRVYTIERVSRQTRFKQLIEEDERQAYQVIDEIVQKASGVFLWVIIVVNRLLEGLRNYDELPDLKMRLEDLPADLEALYQHMLCALDPNHRSETARTFQLVYRSILVETDVPLSPIHLAHLANGNPHHSIESPVQPMSSRRRLQSCLAVEGRIRSRCCGLVEVVQDWSLGEKDRMKNARVCFLHRTVAEFLRDPPIWDQLVSMTADQDFDTNISLLNACLLEVKTNSVEGSINADDDVVWRNLRACFQYARLAEGSGGSSQTMHIIEIERAMSSHWDHVHEWSYGDSDNWYSAQGESWVSSVFPDNDDGLYHGLQQMHGYTSIHALAARAGLLLYIQEKWQQSPSSITYDENRQAMLGAIYGQAFNFQVRTSIRSKDSFSIFVNDDGTVPSEHYVAILAILLPYQVKLDPVVWLAALQQISNLVEYSQCAWDTSAEQEIILWARILELLLESGADANAKIELGARPGSHQQSASMVVRRLFQQLPNSASSARPVFVARDRLTTLFALRRAPEREWKQGKQVYGPAEIEVIISKPDPDPATVLDKGFRARLKKLPKFLRKRFVQYEERLHVYEDQELE
ncbi:MAG: hypothetical protein L6R41_000913 [Letrouitia leprolyta]|nr:MAG: hypothetical protein L6R41_000913 [Letrouitia leprolyta]